MRSNDEATRCTNNSLTGKVQSGQEEVFAFLTDPATHGLLCPVKRIDTHAASVFLAGDHVYKVKRAVRFPFLDQTTLQLRRQACETEVRVNRQFTPELYLGTVAITRSGNRLEIDGDGEVVEWAVHLKRFDESQTFDLVADRGELTSAMIAQIADLIHESHLDARISDGAKATAALAEVLEETLDELVAMSEVFGTASASTLAKNMRSSFGCIYDLLLERGEAGYARRCHGDLHLRNIALLERGPVLFDAIEFDESIATIDVFYDLAFALMDLWQHSLEQKANLLLNRYLWRSDDLSEALRGLAVLPLFMSLRAAVVAKVAAIRFISVDHSDVTKREAQRYFDLASRFLTRDPTKLIAIGGLSGSGKTMLAAHLAPSIGSPPGAAHLRSDIERKRQFGVPEVHRLPDSAYSYEASDRVFTALREQAEIALRAGHSVIVDAVHRTPEERQLIGDVASSAGVEFEGLWLDAPLPMLVDRVERRKGDASDATAEIVRKQAQQDFGPIDWTRLDASVGLDAVIDSAMKAASDLPLSRAFQPH